MDIHVVQPGDTMYRLAQQYGVPMERLLQDNQLENPSQLVVGQTIVVQYPELTHTVRAGDSLYAIAQMHNTTVAQGAPYRQRLRIPLHRPGFAPGHLALPVPDYTLYLPI